MAKQSGLGDRFAVGGYDLSGDIGSLQRVGGGPATQQDVTGINKSAIERIGLHVTGEIGWSGFFNDAIGALHPVMKLLPTADTMATYGRGASLGSPAACLVCKQMTYDQTRAADGSLTTSGQKLSNAYPLEWGVQLTAWSRTDTAATNGTGVDLGSASPGAFGAQFYAQVFAVTGTSVTLTVQESSDNGAGDAWTNITGGAFTAVTPAGAPTWQRIATGSINVERYLRVVSSGTFSNAQFLVVAIRNETAVSF